MTADSGRQGDDPPLTSGLLCCAGSSFAALGFAAFSLAMMAGRFFGDRVARCYGGPAVLGVGAGIAAALLVVRLLAGAPIVALVGFDATGLGLANAMPILFSATGKIAGTPPELAIAAISTAGYCGFLVGPPVIGLIADRFSLGAGLGLVAFALAVVALGGVSTALQGNQRRWMASVSASK